MYYKPLSEITFSDVEEFCFAKNDGRAINHEDIRVEFKREIVWENV